MIFNYLSNYNLYRMIITTKKYVVFNRINARVTFTDVLPNLNNDRFLVTDNSCNRESLHCALCDLRLSIVHSNSFNDELTDLHGLTVKQFKSIIKFIEV